eukprot:1709270-Pyramimonas_sp.AAC.1
MLGLRARAITLGVEHQFAGCLGCFFPAPSVCRPSSPLPRRVRSIWGGPSLPTYAGLCTAGLGNPWGRQSSSR